MIHVGHASDDEKCLSFIKRRMNINRSKHFSFVIIIIITTNDQTKISKLKSHQIALHFVVYLFITCRL